MQAEAVGGMEATPGTGPSRQGVKSEFIWADTSILRWEVEYGK